jgi:hypothetical protein
MRGVLTMPVHIRTNLGDLRLTLSNGDEVLDIQVASTPQEANRIGIMMLASRDVFEAGDTLTCRRANETKPVTVLRGGPEAA